MTLRSAIYARIQFLAWRVRNISMRGQEPSMPAPPEGSLPAIVSTVGGLAADIVLWLEMEGTRIADKTSDTRSAFVGNTSMYIKGRKMNHSLRCLPECNFWSLWFPKSREEDAGEKESDPASSVSLTFYVEDVMHGTPPSRSRRSPPEAASCRDDERGEHQSKIANTTSTVTAPHHPLQPQP